MPAKQKRAPKRTELVEEPVDQPEYEDPHEGHQIIPGNEWEPPRMIMKPPGQVPDLTEKDLSEEHTRVLKADNPQAPDNLARFNHKEKCYKFDPTVDQTAIALTLEGLLLHTDSDDLKRQKVAEEMEREAILKENERRKAESGEQADADDARGLRNQFNFSERASQTLNAGTRERGTITEPPASVEYAAIATQWEIYDSYMEDQERQKQAKEKSKSKKGAEEAADGKGGAGDESEDLVHSETVGQAAKILERMVNQNACDEVTMDYKYWEDASDAYREGEGTLLPLWKFGTEKAKRKHVTSIQWNPAYDDMFVVGYGSYDFMKQGSGLICGFSLKNHSYPEFTFTTETGVMCLDWHPVHQSLLCVGLYDGTVCVFDVHQAKNVPIFQSTVKTGKHTDPVWEVKWQEEDLAKNLNFFSVSSDGRVTLWTLGKNNLEYSDVMELKLVGASEAQADDEVALCGLAGGSCFDFNRQSEHLFMVGTEEGKIHKCSKAYNSQYLETYDSHHMAVYTVRWNHFHPDVFVSCSADWTVKVWDHRAKHPRMSYDLNNQVGDVAWTPWSSTTFAACTADGKVHVFDLNENKNEAMCEQKVVRKAKLTKLAFNHNPKSPCLLVGDDHGLVTSLKLSPNMRWTAVSKAEAERKAKEAEEAAAAGGRPSHRAQPKKAADDGAPKKSPEELEVEKLDKILEVAAKTGEFNYAADNSVTKGTGGES